MADTWSELVAPGVRLYQRTPGSPIYLSISRHGEKSRRSLGHMDHVRARQEALSLAPATSGVARDGSSLPVAPLTLDLLVLKFSASAQCQQRVDHQQAAARLAFVADAIGRQRTVESLVPDDIDGYAHRRARKVRPNTIRAELAVLKAACRWAVKNRHAVAHPFGSVRIDKDMNPVRPILSNEEIDKLIDVADPMQRRLLFLARDTGRRIRALRELRWDDIDLVKGAITWRSETDKTNRTSITPMADRLWDFLKTVPAAERTSYVIRAKGKGKTTPIVTTTAERWLNEMMTRAKLVKPKGGGWHMFRRRWATDRSEVPLKMAMDAGGWKSVAVFVETYQRSDEAGLREAMNAPIERLANAKKAAPVTRQYGTGTVSQMRHTKTHKTA